MGRSTRTVSVQTTPVSARPTAQWACGPSRPASRSASNERGTSHERGWPPAARAFFFGGPAFAYTICASGEAPHVTSRHDRHGDRDDPDATARGRAGALHGEADRR